MRPHVLLVALAVACATPNESIVAAGRHFPIGTRVVLWTEPGAYDAYSLDPRFPAELAAAKRKAPEGKRYGRRRGLPEGDPSLGDLQRVVDQFVIHYDVCGTSRQCFKILQDIRKLSVHFMLDVDGTIYQTLDLAERAWHATKSNDRSVGIEIAHIGAYPRQAHRVLHEWYPSDAGGPYVRFPNWMKQTGVRTPGFVARPSRKEIVHGVIQGQELWQYDFTDAQYAALAKLVAGLTLVFPKLRLDYPREADGTLRRSVLSPDAWRAYSGLIGHYHVQKNKTDPGPAFDWDRVLDAARAGRIRMVGAIR